MKKILAALGVALGFASAPGFAVPLACSDVTSISAWDSLTRGCQIGDKLFSYISSDLDTNLDPSFISSGLSYSFALFPNIQNVGSSAITGFILYSVAVIDPAPYVISSVRLDSTVPFSGTTVTKDFGTGYEGNFITGSIEVLESINGEPDNSTNPLSVTTLYIRDDFTVGAGSNLVSFSNTITQSYVPEPSMLSLFGVMLAAGGFFGTRGRKS
jgi:hypothetical protein